MIIDDYIPNQEFNYEGKILTFVYKTTFGEVPVVTFRHENGHYSYPTVEAVNGYLESGTLTPIIK